MKERRYTGNLTTHFGLLDSGTIVANIGLTM